MAEQLSVGWAVAAVVLQARLNGQALTMEKITNLITAYRGNKRISKQSIEEFLADWALRDFCKMDPGHVFEFSDEALNALMGLLQQEYSVNPDDVNLLFDALKLKTTEPHNLKEKIPSVSTLRT